MKKLKFNASFFDKAQTGSFIGQDAINGRVTVEPLWSLRQTNPSYGNSIKGPYRYFQTTNGSSDQYEIPNISSIDINRSLGQDLATCNISMYNMWHEGNTTEQQLDGQLGYPGYFWPKRGDGDLDLWSQTPGQGAFKKNGDWNGSFSWNNVLIPHALIRTYQGYGGNPTEDNYTSIDDNLENENVVITGLWLIDSIQAGSDGKLTLTCRDIGRILLDQIVFPPVIPGGLYPLEYYPAGKSAFDSIWGPAAGGTGVSPASKGEVRLVTSTSSGDSDSTKGAHYNSHSNDGNPSTFSLSEAFASTNSGTVWFQFTIPSGAISSLNLTPWAGGYECYISIQENSVWQGTEYIPNYGEGFGGVKYVSKVNIPQAIPDGHEIDISAMEVQLPRQYGSANQPLVIRVYFKNLYYSGIPGVYGNQYRAGIRDIVAYRVGADVSPYDVTDMNVLPFTTSIAPHPVRGYWVLDTFGNVYGFGDAADYDSSAFGQVPLESPSLYDSIGQHSPWPYGRNQAASITAHPDGKGYWVLDWMGHVWAYGSADLYEGGAGGETQHVIRWPVRSDRLFELNANYAKTISATHTGEGYYVIYGDGTVYAFGDAMYGMDRYPGGGLKSVTYLPETATRNWMIASKISTPQNYYYMHGGSVQAHPSAHGFWAVTSSGEVFAYGAAKNYGGLVNRTYNAGMASQFHMSNHEYTRSIRCTKTGKGYWITFPTGNIAAFGDAVGQGPANVNQDVYLKPQEGYVVEETRDVFLFRQLVWDLAPDPDGTGFWALIANGNVLEYNAESWGSPGWTGRTGYRWHDGNFNGDWTEIVKDVLLWSGFTLYNPNITGADDPEVYGMLEGTAIRTDSIVSGEKFDKKTIIDVIKELATVVGYNAYVTEEGLFKFASPNWWQAGNFDENGLPIYVSYDDTGGYTRVGEGYEPPDIGPPPAPAVLTSGQYLSQSVISGAGTRVGSQISCNGAILRMQTDGNLVLIAGATTWGRYFPAASVPIWNSGTWGNPGAYAVMQADGNLVIYKGPWASKVAIWNSGTYGNNNSQLHLQYDRNLVIYKPAVVGSGKSAIWNTKTAINTAILPTPFIPVIHESVDMFSYNATLSGGDDRTEIIVGTDLPDPKDASRTGYVRHIPPVANEYVWPGIKKLRGIEKPAMWISALFQNNEEAQLMAELIGIHAWFAQRNGSVSCVANPCITIDDQIRIVERNTNETYIHRVTAVDSKMNLDSGEWTYDLTTHWLGDASNWVISNSPQVNAPYPYVTISERVDSWQSVTARGLGAAAAGSTERFAIMRGEFDSISETLPRSSIFGIEPKTLGAAGTGDIDNTLHVNLMLYGNGVKWALDENATPESWEDSGISLASAYASANMASKSITMTLGYCPPYYQVGSGNESPDPSKYTDLADAYVEILSDQTIFLLSNIDPVTGIGDTIYYPDRVIVWKNLYDFDTIDDYVDFYNIVYAAVKAWNNDIMVYGPSCDVTDTTSLNYFIANADGYDGIALHGDYSDSTWETYLAAIDEITTAPLIVSLDGGTAGSPEMLFNSVDSGSIVFWPSNEEFIAPDAINAGQWVFNGTLQLYSLVHNCKLTTNTLTAPLGSYVHIEIYDGSRLIFNAEIAPVSEYISIPNIGVDNSIKDYTFKIKGIASSTGNGVLKMTLSGDNIDQTSISDTLIVVGI